MAQPGWITPVRDIGPAREVVGHYLDEVNEREVQSTRRTHKSGQEPAAQADRDRRSASSELEPGRKWAPESILLAGQPCIFRLHYSAATAIDQAVFGIGFLHESGERRRTQIQRRTGARPAQGDGYVDFAIEESLQPAAYRVSTAIVDRGHTYDYADREWDLHVRATGEQEPGLARMPGLWLGPSLNRRRRLTARERGIEDAQGESVATILYALATGFTDRAVDVVAMSDESEIQREVLWTALTSATTVRTGAPLGDALRSLSAPRPLVNEAHRAASAPGTAESDFLPTLCSHTSSGPRRDADRQVEPLLLDLRDAARPLRVLRARAGDRRLSRRRP